MITATRRAALMGGLAGSSLLAAGAASAGTPSDTRRQAMERLLAPWAATDRPGVAVTVVLDGQRVFSRGLGAADLEQATPITPRTRFQAASVCKQFTAYAILLLAQEGRLSLNDQAGRHLPEIAGPTRSLTLRHLLHHTGGLRDQYSLINAAGWRSDDAVTQEQLRRMVFRQSGLNFTPGERFQYTNTGYFLLAEIVSRVSGQPLPAFARERIFQPLGMADTQFCDDSHRLLPGRAGSYSPKGAGFEAAILNDATVGPTGLVTTSEDLCRWAQAFEGPQAKTGALAAMHEQAVLKDGVVHYYAMGQERHPYNGLDTWSHGGRSAGYRSFLLRIPDQRFSVAVLSNTSAFDAASIAYAAADIHLSDRPGFLAPPMVEDARPDAARLDRYAGAYELFPGLILMLARDGETLTTRWMGGKRTTAMPALSATAFAFDADANISLEFDPSETGRPRSLIYRIGRNGQLDAPRLDLVPFDKATVKLTEYTGLYRSADLAAEYELLLDGDRLTARHQRLADIPIEPYQPDLFHSLQAFFGRLAFRRDMAGRIDGFSLSAAVAEGIWFERVR